MYRPKIRRMMTPMKASLFALALWLPLFSGAAETPAPNTPRAPHPPNDARAFRDLEYVTNGHARQKLDVHLPATGTNWPLIVWIHGGA